MNFFRWRRLSWGVRVLSVVLLAFAEKGLLPGQAAPPAAQGDHRITLDVVVTDKAGTPIRGLTANDFTVLDNKDPQKLLDFRSVEAKGPTADAVHVVIVVDMINTGFQVVARERSQLSAFLKENGGEMPNPTSIAVMAETGLKVARGSSRDGNALQLAFTKTDSELRSVGRDAGFYGAGERLDKSLDQLRQLASYEAQQPGRKMILFLSPGWPLFPMAGDQADLKQRTQVFNELVRFTNGLRESDIALYTLDPYELGATDPFEYQQFLKPVTQARDAQYGHLGLQVLSVNSGGQVLVSGRDVTGELNRAIRDGAVSYELSFEAAAGERANEHHALQVKVNRPDAVVRTTKGYYAQSPVPAESH